MNPHRLRRIIVRILSLSLCLFLSAAAPGDMKSPSDAPPAAASPATPAAEPTAAPASSTAPEPKPEPSAEDKAREAADADKVVLNLKGVGIDQLMKFLSELTGKPVMKYQDAKAQITIVSDAKVQKQDAVRMICEALRLGGTALVERDKVIWLVPEDKVQQLDVALTVPEGRIPQVGVVSRALSVKFADVAELEKLIKPLLGKNATLIAHPGSRKLIITDNIDRIESVESVIAQLDALELDDRQVRIFQLLHADAEELAPILRALLGAGGRGGAASAPSAPPGGPGGPSSPAGRSTSGNDVDVQPYKAVNWLLVMAPREKLAKISLLVDELDQEVAQEVKLRVIQVKYAAAEELARQLGSLVQKRYSSKKVREVIEVAADQRSNSLVVLSSAQNYDAIQKIVKELDTADSVQTKTKWYPLKYADADELAEQMNTLYQGMQEENPYGYFFYGGYSRRSEVKTRFVAEKRTNSLIAIAAPTEFERITEIVERLDTKIEGDQSVAPRIFPIKNNDAKELADVLNRVFGIEDTGKTGGYIDWLYSRTTKKSKIGRLYGQVRFDPLIASNAIIVTTNVKDNFPIVEAFIREMDENLPESANLLVVTLKNAQALDLAKQLNALFGREGARPPEKKETTGDEAYVSFLYGQPPKKDERPISDLIGRVRVVPDVRTNQLLITTPAQYHAALQKLVERLDVASPKVFVAVRLIEVNRTKSSRIGTRFSSTPAVFESADFDNGVQSNFGFKWTDVHNNGVLSAEVNISALVQFMLGRFDTRILSDTTMMMDNNRQSTIFVGSKIPFITQSSVAAGQTNTSFDYKDAGTKLIITPIINTENRVVMDIKMEASQARPGVLILGGQVIDTRNFETMLAVENNQTVVMGGILKEQNVENVRRTPILGYIPIVNWLFAKKDTQHDVTELIAFITPVVLRFPGDDAAITQKAEEGIRSRHEWPILPLKE